MRYRLSHGSRTTEKASSTDALDVRSSVASPPLPGFSSVNRTTPLSGPGLLHVRGHKARPPCMIRGIWFPSNVSHRSRERGRDPASNITAQPTRHRLGRWSLDPLQLGDRPLVSDCSRIDGCLRLDQQRMDLIVGNGQMLNATRDDDELTGSQVDVAVPEL